MLPPAFPATPVPFERNLMLNRLPNYQLLAVPTLHTPIIPSSHHLRVIREAIRSQLVFVARKRLQGNLIAWTPPRSRHGRIRGEAEVVVAEAGVEALHERLQVGYRG